MMARGAHLLGRAGALAAILLLGFASAVQAGATLVIVNLDGPSEGLNDPSPLSPGGGNPAPTLGEARLRAVELAASLWANLLSSDVPIRIEVQFDSLGGTDSYAALGLGGATKAFRDFTGAPRAGTWYVSAEADALAGTDLDPSADDVEALQLRPRLRRSGSFSLLLRLRRRGACRGHRLRVDRAPELAHGLGFETFLDLDTGEKLFGYDDAFMVNLASYGAVPPDLPSMTDLERLSAFTSGPALHWTGASADEAGSGLTAGVAADGHLEMYAPDPAVPRQSLVHFSDAITPDDLMEPFYVAPRTHLELVRASKTSDGAWRVRASIPACRDRGLGEMEMANARRRSFSMIKHRGDRPQSSSPGTRCAFRRRFSLLCLLIAIFALLLPAGAAAQASDPDAVGIVWVGTSSGLFKVSSETGEVLLRLPFPVSPSRLAVDRFGGVLWAYTDSVLHALDFSGQSLFDIPLPVSGPAADLIVDDADGTVRLAVGTSVMRFDQQGQDLGGFSTASPVVALGIDQFNRLWIAFSSAVTAFDAGTGS